MNTYLKLGGITVAGAAVGVGVSHFMKKNKVWGGVIGGVVGVGIAIACCKDDLFSNISGGQVNQPATGGARMGVWRRRKDSNGVCTMVAVDPSIPSNC